MKSGVIWIWCCLILLSLLQLAFVSTSTLADEVHEQEAEDYDDEDTLLKEILLENQMEDAEYVDDTAHDVNPDGRSSSHNEEQQQKQTKASPRSPGGRRGNVRSKLDTSVHNRPANGKSKTQTSRSKGSNGGSYYGENKAKEQRELLQKREAGQKSKEKSKITSMSGDRRRQIESLLSENVRANIAQGEEEQASRNAEKLQRQMRYKMSRKFAKPVEDVLEIYNAVDVDFYKLLDVKKQWDENKIKKQYRMKALIVHPGKCVLFVRFRRFFC